MDAISSKLDKASLKSGVSDLAPRISCMTSMIWIKAGLALARALEEILLVRVASRWSAPDRILGKLLM